MVENYGGTSIQAIVPLLRHVDKFVDIMNARREKDCHNINCTTHPHLDELLEILEYFVAWKKYIG